MQVAMDELVQLYTCRTGATGITLSLAAQQIVGKSNGNGKLAVTARTGYKQGVRQTVAVDTAAQLLDYAPLSYHIFEENTHQYIAFAISYTLSNAFRV